MPLELDAFLKEGTQPAVDGAQASAEPTAPETPPTEAKAPETPQEPAAKAPKGDATAEPEDSGPVRNDDTLTVQFSALEKVRNDWRSKFAAEQARAEMLAKQLEEAKKAPPPLPAPPPQPQLTQLPDFNQNPAGYIQAMAIRQQEILLNERLNMSEAMLREKIGDEKVDAYVADFKKFVEQDPSLREKLYAQATPYQWMTKEVDRRRMHAEIGDDPVAFREKLRQQIAAEMAAQMPTKPTTPASPLAGQPPSLAGERSVAARGTSAFTGPPSMDDILRRPAARR